MFKKIIPFIVFALFAASPPLEACSICGCGDPLQAAGDALPMPGQFRLTLDSELLTATAADEADPARTDSLTQKSLLGGLTFSPTSDLSMTLVLALVGKDGKGEGGVDPVETVSNFGLGDLNFGIRYFFLTDTDFKTRQGQSLAFSVGTYIPTGNNKLEDAGTRIDEHDQLGAGSWGPYGGISYVLRGEKWNLSANFTTVLRTTNSYGYHYGNALKWGVQGQYRFTESFALSLAAEGRTADQDTDTETPVDNTGGTVLDLTPALWVSPMEGWSLYSRIQIPVLTGLIGIQTVGVTATVGTQFLVN